MQLLWNPGMSLEQYAKTGEISYPTIEKCPMCGARKPLIGHGFYQRNAVPHVELAYRLRIRRLLCKVCHKTVSLLPWFLLPRFQYSLQLIFECLRNKARAYRQLRQHWWKRYQRNLNRTLAFFRSLGFNASLPRAPDKKAINLLRTTENLGLTRFSSLHHELFRRSFMAL